MGRPLNKKYFGNRNIGRNGREGISPNHLHDSGGEGIQHDVPAGDDGIGGEGLAGVNFSNIGSYLDKIPAITAIGAPTIPGGIQAAAAVATVQAVNAVVNQTGTPTGADYRSDDILTVTTGTNTSPAKFMVQNIQVAGYTIVTGNDGNTAHGYAVGDALNFDNGVILTVATIDGSGGYPANLGVVTSLTLTNRGELYGTAPTGAIGQTDPNQVGGRGLTVDFVWGVKNVILAQAGSYSAVAAGASTTTVTHHDLSASSATGCTLDVFYGIETITVSEKGSGYTGAETITFTAANVGQSETRATGTIALTTDTGAVGSATNQENAIIARVYYDEEIQIADIVKQQGSRSYIVITKQYPGSPDTEKEDEPVLARLVDHEPQDLGEYAPVKEMTIIATDSDHNTYYVTKLTAHKATLVRKTFLSVGQWQFEDGQAAPWQLFEGQPFPIIGYVKIENA